MSKAFWEGLFEGLWKASVILNPFIILWLSYMLVFHPYEQCKRNGDCGSVQYIPAQTICEDMYNTDEDIGECVWILENTQ